MNQGAREPQNTTACGREPGSSSKRTRRDHHARAVARQMRHFRSAMGAELQAEAFGLGQIVAFHRALALRPAEGFGLHEAVGGMRRTGGFAAARAMAIHEPLERQLDFILHRFAKTASMRSPLNVPLVRPKIDLIYRRNYILAIRNGLAPFPVPGLNPGSPPGSAGAPPGAFGVWSSRMFDSLQTRLGAVFDRLRRARGAVRKPMWKPRSTRCAPS